MWLGRDWSAIAFELLQRLGSVVSPACGVNLCLGRRITNLHVNLLLLNSNLLSVAHRLTP